MSSKRCKGWHPDSTFSAFQPPHFEMLGAVQKWLSHMFMQWEPWTWEHLVPEQAITLGQAIDVSPWRNFGSALNSYLSFVHMHNMPVEPTPDSLSLYTVYMCHHIKPNSVDTYLYGICNQLEPYFPNVQEIRKSRLVHCTLEGCKDLWGTPTICKQQIFWGEYHHSMLQSFPLQPTCELLCLLALAWSTFSAIFSSVAHSKWVCSNKIFLHVMTATVLQHRCRWTINAHGGCNLSCRQWSSTTHHSRYWKMGFASLADLHSQTFCSPSGNVTRLTARHMPRDDTPLLRYWCTLCNQHFLFFSHFLISFHLCLQNKI